MGTIKIVAAVVDTRQLVLYHADGTKTTIPQGDPRVRRVIDEVLPVVQIGEVAEINLNADIVDPNTIYDGFEEKTGGLVKFFRVAKSKLKNIFSGNQEEQAVAPTGSFGELPTPQVRPRDIDPQPTTNSAADNMTAAVNEIMTHARPVSSPAGKDDTIVAVIENKVIPGVEQIKDHLNHSNLHGSTIGIQNLLKRLGAIIDKRGHSVDDVLKFLERGDLPVADDGTIIAYKRLCSTSKPGVFVDPHTRKVTQRVGSYVVMDESLVDPNRRNECSNGLHIARRGYLHTFTGDVCVIAKIAPEDVIAVPHRDPNKVRVCGYHIVFQLDAESFQKVTSNKPMADNEKAQRLIARAISGDHIGIIEEVRITGQQGNGLVITDRRDGAKKDIAKTIEVPAHAANVQQAPTEEDRKLDAAPVSPKEISEKVQEFQMPTIGSQRDKAAYLLKTIMSTGQSLEMQIAATKALNNLKKTSKKSWDVLGVTATNLKVMENLLKDEPAPVKTSKTTKALTAAMKGTPPIRPTIKDNRPYKAPQAKAVSPVKAQPEQEAAKPEPVEPKITTVKPKVADGLTDKERLMCERIQAGTLSKSQAAKNLGVHRRTVDRLLLKFGR